MFSALQKALIFQKIHITATCFNYNIFPMSYNPNSSFLQCRKQMAPSLLYLISTFNFNFVNEINLN